MAKVARNSGIAGAGFLLVGLGAPPMIENLPESFSLWMTVIGVALIVVAVAWHFLGRTNDGAVAEISTGDHSPVTTTEAGGDVITLNHSGIGNMYGKVETLTVQKRPPRSLDDPKFASFKSGVLENSEPDFTVQIESRFGDDEATALGEQFYQFFKSHGYDKVGHDYVERGPWTGADCGSDKLTRTVKVWIGSDGRQ